MSYSIDSNGFLDLSQCYMGYGCNLLLACTISKDYFFSEMQELITWDGKRITNMQYEDTWWHLVSKHEPGREKKNPLTHLDLERVKRLPLLKEVLSGNVAVDVYKQINKKGVADILQLTVDVDNQNYVVCLGLVKGSYIIRSAYPSDNKYVSKVKQRSLLITEIRP